MADKNNNIPGNDAKGDFTFESILAEYKGTAFINGDKRTPPELLKEQADRIIKEAVGSNAPDSPHPKGESAGIEEATQEAPPNAPHVMDEQVSFQGEGLPERPETRGEESEKVDENPVFRIVEIKHPGFRGNDDSPTIVRRAGSEESDMNATVGEQSAAPGAGGQPGDSGEDNDNVVLFFENYRSPVAEEQETAVWNEESPVQRASGVYGEVIPESSKWGFRTGSRYDSDEEGSDYDEDEVFEEPDLKEAAGRFALACNSVSLRFIPAGIISLIMVILTFASEAGLIIPFGIGHSQILATGALMLSLLVVMILSADLLVRGAVFLIRGAPNAETLILFSCAFSFISAVYSVITGESAVLPYCAVSALSLTFAAFGEKLNLRAITETLKTASISAKPYGLQAEKNSNIKKSVLKKAYNRTDGFYNNLMHPDVTEIAYRYAAPMLLVGALLLSLLVAFVRGGAGYFLHILSALLAAAAPFSALLSFSLPFGTVAKSIRASGAALAGWGGADDVCYTDGACITDDDLFPPGTLDLNGLKLFDGVPPEKAIRYTASLIIASGSGLSGLFAEILKMQAMSVIKVEDFACHEGGIGALIRGERVATGSGAFMNLIGVRVPDDTNMKNAVYTAVNGSLIAMFTVDYTPINSVQSALISILKWRIKLFFAVRDFNVTPLMLEQKFRVSLEGIEYIQTRDSYSISDSFSGKGGRMAAILTREGLGPFAEAVTGGRLLKSSALFATIVSVISAAIGVLIMFYMCWSGAYLSARPGNLLLFMLSMLAAVLVVCGYVKCKK